MPLGNSGPWIVGRAWGDMVNVRLGWQYGNTRSERRQRPLGPRKALISFPVMLSGADIFYVKRYLVAWKKTGAAKQIESIRSRTPP